MDSKQKHSVLALVSSVLDHPEKVIAVYRGWEAFERSRGGPSIVDFDLTSITEAIHYESRREILYALEELREHMDTSSHEGEFLRDKIDGSIFYLRALMEEQIPFSEYIEHTMGISPVYFSDDEIENIRSNVNDLLSHFGLELKQRYREQFEAQWVIHDPETIKQGIIGNVEPWLARLRQEGIPCPKALNIRMEYVEVDAYWSNWVSGSYRDGFRLRINLHSRKKYDLGRPLALCLHEICGHAVQMTIWGDLIAQGKLNHAFGLTTVHSPETFVAEGLAQTVPDLLAQETDFPVEFRVSRWLHYYSQMILHNAHLMLYDDVPRDEIMNYATTNLPFSSPAMIRAEIRDRSTNPLYRTYQLSYASAERTIRNLIRHLSSQRKRQLFLAMYTQPMTPRQLERLGRALQK